MTPKNSWYLIIRILPIGAVQQAFQTNMLSNKMQVCTSARKIIEKLVCGTKLKFKESNFTHSDVCAFPGNEIGV